MNFYRDKKGRFVEGHPDFVPKKARKKAALKMKDRQVSLETRKKISLANKGKKFPYKPHYGHRGKLIGQANPSKRLEVRKKISLAKKGKSSPWTAQRNKINKGERAPNWQGGISFEPYSPEFNKGLKEQIRKRDNYTCQECSYTQDQLSYVLAVHHIDYNKRNNWPDNLISLCKVCHSQTNFSREDWTKYYKEKIRGIIQ